MKSGPPQLPEQPHADVLPQAAVLDDLAQLSAALTRAAVYPPEARAAVTLDLQRLHAQATSLSTARFLAGLARITARARDGHTNLDFGQLGQALPQLPMRFRWFADGLYVTAVSAAHAGWLGSQVVRVEGRPAEAWGPLLSGVIGGTAPRVRHLSPPVLITPALLQALGWADDARQLRLQFRTPDGRLVSTHIAADEAPVSLSLTPQAELLHPPTPGASVHVQTLPGQALYVGLRQLDSGTDGPLPEVLGQVLSRVRATCPARVIVDLRGNGGGNYVLGWPFTQRLREAAGPARIYALTDEGTFSAAIVTLAWLRHDAGARLVGQAPGDHEQFYAEPICVELTSTRARLFLATQSHDWAADRHDLTTCFWLNLLYGVPAGSLRPDVDTPRTFTAFRQGRDAALHAALTDDTPFAAHPRQPPVSGPSPAPHQVACSALLLTTLGTRHGREEWRQMGRLIGRLSGLSAQALDTLRRQQQPLLSRSDAELISALRTCRSALAPLVIAYARPPAP